MPKFTIQILEPCSERWADMKPTDQGRLCASCQHVVVDYTNYSDQELARRFSQSAEPGCGRFRPEQLGRSLNAKDAESAPWRHWLNLITLGLFGWQTARAQVQPAGPARPPVSVRPDYAATPLSVHQAGSTTFDRVIRGRVWVRDSTSTLSPFAGGQVTVSLSGKNWQTDSAGVFEIPVTVRGPIDHVVVRVTGPGARIVQQAFEVAHPNALIQLGDIVVQEPRHYSDIVGGMLAITPGPSRWQKLKRKLFR